MVAKPDIPQDLIRFSLVPHGMESQDECATWLRQVATEYSP
jgi:hypothetical protein